MQAGTQAQNVCGQGLTATTPVAFAFDSHAVRTITEDDGAIWFVAKDVCNALNIVWKRGSGNSGSLSSLDDDQKGVNTIHTLGGAQEMVVINESGLYALTLRSRKPEAKQFARWVTGEVLPSIRRQGYYGGSALPALAQAVTRTQAIVEGLAERLIRTDEKVDALLTLVDVYGKYTALLEANQKPKRKVPRPVTPEVEDEIRALLAQGMGPVDVAANLNVSRSTVYNIKAGRWHSRQLAVRVQEGGAA